MNGASGKFSGLISSTLFVENSKGTKYSSPIFFLMYSLTRNLSANSVCSGLLSFSFNQLIFSFKVFGFFKSNSNPCAFRNLSLHIFRQIKEYTYKSYRNF